MIIWRLPILNEVQKFLKQEGEQTYMKHLNILVLNGTVSCKDKTRVTVVGAQHYSFLKKKN